MLNNKDVSIKLIIQDFSAEYSKPRNNEDTEDMNNAPILVRELVTYFDTSKTDNIIEEGTTPDSAESIEETDPCEHKATSVIFPPPRLVRIH